MSRPTARDYYCWIDSSPRGFRVWIRNTGGRRSTGWRSIWADYGVRGGRELRERGFFGSGNHGRERRWGLIMPVDSNRIFYMFQYVVFGVLLSVAPGSMLRSLS